VTTSSQELDLQEKGKISSSLNTLLYHKIFPRPVGNCSFGDKKWKNTPVLCEKAGRFSNDLP